jgi:CRP-like cAMP-binding protein
MSIAPNSPEKDKDRSMLRNSPVSLLNIPENFTRPESSLSTSSSQSLHVETTKQLIRAIKAKQMQIDQLSQEQLIDLGIVILQKPVQYRSTQDVEILVRCTREIQFFKTHDATTHEKCLKHMYHQRLLAGETLFAKGTIGTTFYVILKGKVGVWIPAPGSSFEEENMTEIKVLEPGAAFGELALMDSKPRAATIVCNEDCDFAVLDKEPFRQILKAKEELKMMTDINFLFSLRLFNKCTFNYIKEIYYMCALTQFTRGQKVFREGDAADKMYIIKTGEFKVSNILELDGEQGFLKRRRNARKKEVEVALLGIGEIFGEWELITKETRRATISCASGLGEVYVIQKRDFHRKLCTDPCVLQWLKEHIPTKEHIRDKRIYHIAEKTSEHKHLMMYPQVPVTSPTPAKDIAKAKFKFPDIAPEYLQTEPTKRSSKESSVETARTKRKFSPQQGSPKDYLTSLPIEPANKNVANSQDFSQFMLKIDLRDKVAQATGNKRFAYKVEQEDSKIRVSHSPVTDTPKHTNYNKTRDLKDSIDRYRIKQLPALDASKRMQGITSSRRQLMGPDFVTFDTSTTQEQNSGAMSSEPRSPKNLEFRLEKVIFSKLKSMSGGYQDDSEPFLKGIKQRDIDKERENLEPVNKFCYNEKISKLNTSVERSPEAGLYVKMRPLVMKSLNDDVASQLREQLYTLKADYMKRKMNHGFQSPRGGKFGNAGYSNNSKILTKLILASPGGSVEDKKPHSTTNDAKISYFTLDATSIHMPKRKV